MSHCLSKSPARPNTPAVAALLLVALVVCAGCGQGGAPPQGAPEVTFPTDLTMYPSAKTPPGAQPGTITSLVTTDPVKKVMAFYEDKSKNGGWDKVTSDSMGSGAGKLTIKKDTRTFMLLFNNNGDETVVDISRP